MAIKKFRPVTPGFRFRSIVRDTVTTRKGPEKSLTEPLHSKGGRNHHGRITVRRRGGGHKRRYRRIDFKRNKIGVVGRVAEIEYDPNRSANIALIHYVDGEKRYILHVRGLAVGDEVLAGGDADIKPGNSLPDRSHSAGHDRAQRGVEARQGRATRPLGGLGRANHGQGRRLRDAASPFHRSPARAHGVRGHHRPGWQHRSRAEVVGQGRGEPVARAPSQGSGRRHEPGGPPRWVVARARRPEGGLRSRPGASRRAKRRAIPERNPTG